MNYQTLEAFSTPTINKALFVLVMLRRVYPVDPGKEPAIRCMQAQIQRIHFMYGFYQYIETNGGHQARGGCQRLLRGQDSLEVHEPSLGRYASSAGCAGLVGSSL
jgi:hypothetical protein